MKWGEWWLLWIAMQLMVMDCNWRYRTDKIVSAVDRNTAALERIADAQQVCVQP